MGLRARYGGSVQGATQRMWGPGGWGVVGGGALTALGDHAETTQCLRGGLAAHAPSKQPHT